MPPTRFLGTAEKLDLILDVLRANKLHQSTCDSRTGQGYMPCDCWLSEPDQPPALPESELRIDLYRQGGGVPTPSVRITHLPTGITVSATAATERQACAEAKADLAEKVAMSGQITPEEMHKAAETVEKIQELADRHRHMPPLNDPEKS